MENNKLLQLRKQIISLSVVAVMALGSLFFIHKNVEEIDAKVLLPILKKLKPEYLVLSLFLLVAYVIVQGSCVASITKVLGHKISMWRYSAYYSADQYFSSITPAASGGQPAALFYLTRDGIPASVATTAVLLNTVLYISSLIVMGLLVLMISPALIFSGGKLFVTLFFIGLGLNVLLVLLCLFCMYFRKQVRFLAVFFIKLLSKIRLFKNPDEKIEAFDTMLEHYKECVEVIGKNKLMMVKVFILNSISRLCLFSVTYGVYLSFGLKECSFIHIIAIQIITTISVNSLPMPGGMGAAEGVFLKMYSKIFRGKILMPAMLVNRTITYYILFILCGIYTIIYHGVTAAKRGRKAAC